MDLVLNRKLISEVEKRPVLYDEKLKNNRTQEDITLAWVEIASVVHKPETFCKDRWMNIRSTYAKDLQKLKRTYYLKDYLEFLLEHIESTKCKALNWKDTGNSRTSQNKAADTSQRHSSRKTMHFNSPYNTETNDKDPVPGPSGSRLSDGSSCSQSTPPSAGPITGSRKRGRPDDHRLSLVGEHLEDEFNDFGKFVSSMLRQLSEDQQQFAEKLIIDVLFKGKIGTLNKDSEFVMH